MWAKSNASAESRASHPSQPYAGNARKRRARKYPRKSDATVAAVSARPSVVRTDGMSVSGAVLGFMITQSGVVFGVLPSHSCYADFPVFCGKLRQVKEFLAQRHE